MAKRKRRSGRRKTPAAFNKYASALKMTKGKSCDRKRVLKAVKGGSSPSAAVKRYCR